MAKHLNSGCDYADSSNGIHTRREKEEYSSDGRSPNVPAYSDGYDNQTGEVYDPYGGKKIGMVRVCVLSVLMR